MFASHYRGSWWLINSVCWVAVWHFFIDLKPFFWRTFSLQDSEPESSSEGWEKSSAASSNAQCLCWEVIVHSSPQVRSLRHAPFPKVQIILRQLGGMIDWNEPELVRRLYSLFLCTLVINDKTTTKPEYRGVSRSQQSPILLNQTIMVSLKFFVKKLIYNKKSFLKTLFIYTLKYLNRSTTIGKMKGFVSFRNC